MKIKQYDKLYRLCVIYGFIAGIAGWGLLAVKAHAACMDLADVPLETLRQSPPGIVMFLIDDSGSMDWNFMVPEPDGVFEGYEYIFPNAGDDVYTSGQYSTVLSGPAKMKWKSQWAGYNRLYYNPESTYDPWPKLPHADPDMPRSNPMNSQYTLSMNQVFYDFSDITTAQIQERGGFIIDNSETTKFSTAGTNGTWATATSSQDFGANYLRSNTNKRTYAAKWTFSNVPSGKYDVYAWWVADTSHSTSVTYYVDHMSGTASGVQNQRTNGGKWNLLFKDIFLDGAGAVRINQYVNSNTSERICADAVAIVPSPYSRISIINAHYYVKNDNGLFLVNLNGDFEYYRIQDNGDDIVALTELEPMTADEALSAGIVTGRTYAQERQNFADWYSFYRRRILTAKAAIAKVINSMKKVSIGLVSIHKRIEQPALPVKIMIDNVWHDYSDTLLNVLYGLSDGGGTPLRLGLKDVGRYFKGEYLKPSTLPSYTTSQTYPFYSRNRGGSCQQGFCIVMTDGYWNETTSPEVGNADGDEDTAFDGGNFKDSYANTLADVAMAFYEKDLNPFLENDVPANPLDHAKHQHMVTYGLSFGVKGTIDREAWPNCPAVQCPVWPDPLSGDPAKIDDLYHAAVNGRGQFVDAASPEELITALEELKHDIEERLAAASSVSANSVRRQVGSMIYQGVYHTDSWAGDLMAIPINVKTGELDPARWQAAIRLDHTDADDRVIFSYSQDAGIAFRYDHLSGAQKLKLHSDPDMAQKMVDYLRGDSAYESGNNGVFRTRNSKLGDIVHSSPAYVNYGRSGAVFVGANDGMMHAFDAATGSEIFAYVPNLVFDNLKFLSSPSYTHVYFVDGSPYAAETEDKILLVCGLGKGGKGYFCLDVTDIFHLTEADAPDIVKWEFSSQSDSDMGYSYGRAYIVNTCAAGWVAIFGNGYDSPSGKAVLYVLNAETGALIKKFDTGISGCNGMSSPTVIDVEFDGYADYVYAGDVKGNLWKFDFTGKTVNQWKISFSDGITPQPLFTAQNANGEAQAITTSPEVTYSCAPGGKGFMVIFGTGRLLGQSDIADATIESFYGIWDWQDMWKQARGESISRKMYLGAFTPERTLSNLISNENLDENGKKITLIQQTVDVETPQWRILTDHAAHYYDVKKNIGSHVGWYFDLPDARERSVRDPLLISGIVVMVSTIPSDAPCDAGGRSILYQLNACTGGRTSEPQFDVNHDRQFDEEDLIQSLPPSGQKMDQIIFDPIEIDGLLYAPDASGQIQRISIPEIPPGITYWRVVE